MAPKQIQNAIVRVATDKDLESLRDMSARLRQSKDPDYFEQQLAYQKEGKRLILMVGEAQGGADSGYCILNWQPKYGYFKAMNIPEIQDLNVLPEFRKRGLATQMIEHCEALAARKGREAMGISFGLHGAFGPAQRLYVKMGYSPDGHGVTYDRKAVSAGEFRPVDDQLCLMLVKNLKNRG